MRSQKELKETYMNVIKTEIWPDSQEMQKYSKSRCAYVVEFTDGTITEIEKPSIKKDFCFGAGMYASATQEEVEEAENMVVLSKSSEAYFKSENLRRIDEKITLLKEALTGQKEVYKFLHYLGQKPGSILVGYSVCSIYRNPENEPGYWANYQDLKKINNEEVQSIIEGFEEVKKSFEKRLDAYLKKYGLSKVSAWSYMRD